jgi:hypothetical protein
MRLAFIFAFVSALFLAGCDSLPDHISTPFNPPPPKSRVFAADERKTYAAAHAALADIGFGFAHGGPAQGRLEAMSGLQTGGDVSLNSTRQLQLEATFLPAADGGTEVDVVLHETVEEDSSQSPGLGTSKALGDSPVFEEFFRAIERRLAAPSG